MLGEGLMKSPRLTLTSLYRRNILKPSCYHNEVLPGYQPSYQSDNHFAVRQLLSNHNGNSFFFQYYNSLAIINWVQNAGWYPETAAGVLYWNLQTHPKNKANFNKSVGTTYRTLALVVAQVHLKTHHTVGIKGDRT